MQNPNNLAWLDMEMTGLNPDSDKIIEVAMIVTDQDLNILAQSDVLVIHQPDSIMDNMDAWNTSTHQRTGLTAKVKAATLTEAEAEQQLLHFMAQWLPEKTSPCAATPSTKTAALWRAICPSWKPMSTTATSMYPP